ncbi:MAG: alpha/beta fold hydrolase BchO [Pseudomonadota bacterium]
MQQHKPSPASLPKGLPADWPHADHSARLDLGHLSWHVQRAGAGAKVLLLHGTGASTHSLRHLFAALSPRFDVLAPDLPGQGFTRTTTLQRSGLDGMTADLGTLLDHLDYTPDAIIGHSAGAAIALNLGAPRIVGLAPALADFPGVLAAIFPMVAKLLALNPLTARIFSRTHESEAQVTRLLRSTGAEPGADDVAYYRQLIGDPAHVEGALHMMARWDLTPLRAKLPGFEGRVTFLTGDADMSVPSAAVTRAAGVIPGARAITLPGMGHLMHETHPDEVMTHIDDALA